MGQPEVGTKRRREQGPDHCKDIRSRADTAARGLLSEASRDAAGKVLHSLQH